MPFEVAVVLVAAIAPLPVPAAVPLLVVASLSLYLRGRSFGDLLHAPALYAVVGAVAGLASLLLAVVVGTPLVERLTDTAVQWSMFPVVRGSLLGFATMAVIVGVTALATELVLRGWIVDRVLELAPSQRLLAVLTGAFAEALITPGPVDVRIGAGLVGTALGWMFVAGNRSLAAAICARRTFSLGALALEALRVVG